MVCGLCGLQWDVNDPEPPGCDPNPAKLPTSPPVHTPAPQPAESEPDEQLARDAIDAIKRYLRGS